MTRYNGTMAQNKTQPTKLDPADFIAAVEHPVRRADAETLDALFRKVTRTDPQMWGASIVGYGAYHYRYKSGHEGDTCRVGFSPRKARLSLYLLGCGADDPEMEAHLAQLGKHSRGVGCLYVTRLANIDLAVLETMIALSWQRSFELYPD